MELIFHACKNRYFKIKRFQKREFIGIYKEHKKPLKINLYLTDAEIILKKNQKSNKKKKRNYFEFILAFIFLLSICHAQQDESLRPLQFRMDVRLLQVQIFAYDKNKEFVQGLKKEDFVLLEDGKKQEIRYIDEINLETAPVIEEIPKPSKTIQSMKPLNNIIFIFDKAHMSQSSAKQIKDSVKDFIISNINSNNLAAIFTLDNQGSYQLLKDFSNSPQELINAIDLQAIASSAIDARVSKIQNIQSAISLCIRKPGAGPSNSRICNNPCDEDLLKMVVSTVAKPYALEEQQNALHTAQSLASIIKFTHHLPGQKTLLLFSEGFDPPGSYYYAFLSDMIQHCPTIQRQPSLAELNRIIGILKDDSKINIMNDLIQKANASSVTVYWLNPQDPDFLFGTDTNIQPEVTTGPALKEVFNQLKRLSDDTGGFAMQTKSAFTDYFNKLKNNLSHYYIISYTPKRLAQDGKVHKIKVEAIRSDIKVMVRKSITDFSNQDQINIMLSSALDFPEFYHQLSAQQDYAYLLDDNNKITVIISLAIPLSGLTSVARGANFIDEVHFAYIVKNDKNAIVVKDHKIGNINIPLIKYEEFAKNNSTFQNLLSFQLKPGTYILYVASAEAGGWKLTGWKTQLNISIKENNCFALSPLLIASQVENILSLSGKKASHSLIMNSDGTITYNNKKISFSAIKNLPLSGQIVGIYQIFNASLTSQSKASVQISFKLIDENNNLISSLPSTNIDDYTDLSKKLITNFFILPYKNLAEKNYKLILEAKDLINNCTAESSTYFTIKQQ